ncbi:hypothetical protein ACJBYY_11830, partial [Streptococcus suis]
INRFAIGSLLSYPLLLIIDKYILLFLILNSNHLLEAKGWSPSLCFLDCFIILNRCKRHSPGYQRL